MAPHKDASELSCPNASIGSMHAGLGAVKDRREEKHCGSLQCHVQSDVPAGLSLTTKNFISLLTADPRYPRTPPDWECEVFWQTRYAKAPGNNCVAPDIVSVHTTDRGPCRRHIHNEPRSCERAVTCPLILTQHALWKGEWVREGWGKLNTRWPSQLPFFTLCLSVTVTVLVWFCRFRWGKHPVEFIKWRCNAEKQTSEVGSNPAQCCKDQVKR